jgi:hypothetical protein
LMYGELGDASETHDIEAFPLLLRLCERDLLKPAKLGEEPMRCKPLSSRCLPLSFGFSIWIASLRGLLGGEDDDSFACSMTTESIERGSMVEVMMVWYATPAEKRLVAGGKGPRVTTTCRRDDGLSKSQEWQTRNLGER